MSAQNHIENPFEFVLEKLSWAVSDMTRPAGPPRVHAAAPEIRRIGVGDLGSALRAGLGDFAAVRADVMFAALIYPLAGLALARLAFSYDLLPLIFPLLSGFALLGPLAAIGLYELSRRHERGEAVRWTDMGNVLRSPRLGSILGLGVILLGLFSLWIAAAYVIYAATLGPAPPADARSFLHDVLSTPAGWTMTLVGCGVGFVFAAVALAISAISFPLLLDRDVGLLTAIGTSLKAVAANPGPMALWGLIVAAALVLGSIPALVGLIVVMPVLGHATWRLYRRVVV